MTKVSIPATAASTSSANSVTSLSLDQRWELLEKAYTYAIPLLMTYATCQTSTNTDEAHPGSSKAPINTFYHARSVARASFRTVVTPNVDTVYSQAWLDISQEPVIYEMPKTDRFFTMQIMDAWTNTAAVLDSPGTYAIIRPDYKGTLPEGVTRVEVPTSSVWLLGRIIQYSQQDLPNVYAIQQQMKLYPLSAYSDKAHYQAPSGKYSKDLDYVPVERVVAMDPVTFFQTANQLMVDNPPAADDADLLGELSAIQVGPGLTFDESILGENLNDIQTRWAAMVQGIRPVLGKASQSYMKKLGQWSYFGEPIGDFGTAYDYRALVAFAGLGANPISVAIYPRAGEDTAGNTLTGEKTYTMHFDTLPPVRKGGFWSVTAYGSNDFLIDNPIDRYCINDRSEFRRNADGSADILLSKEAPAETDNWLPVSDDVFHLYLRIYLPDMDALNTWQAPTITAVE